VSGQREPSAAGAGTEEIERACTRLVLRSIRVFDERDWPAYAQLFTEDGVFIRANEPGEPLVGRAAIESALSARPAHRLTVHFCTNLEVDVVDTKRAEGRCYLLLYSGDASHPQGSAGRPADAVQRLGEYRDSFELTAEGWRIARRVGKLILHTGGR
jgi:uncharacterized protein (TIGR02246 family)